MTCRSCQACRHEAHADVNAARNILEAGMASQALACGGHSARYPVEETRRPRAGSVPVDTEGQ